MSVAHGAPADDDDIRDLVRTLALTTPDQRMAWLESAFEQALDVALDRLERGLLTIDSEGEIWPDALAVEYLWRIGKVRNVPAIHPAAVRIAAITQGGVSSRPNRPM